MKEDRIHEKLITKCKTGDQTAQFEIYKLYYKAMYNVSFRIVQDSMEAEDVMQEAFLSAFGKMDLWSGEVSFGSWLKKIVINKSLDYLKKRKLNETGIDSKDFASDEPDYLNEELISTKVEDVKKAVGELPDHYRVVLAMFLFEGFTHNEIAEYLNITPESSRVRYKRAKEMIVKSINSKPVATNFIYN
jgi:RNA polymerase sigma factor (sigma-70 family)